MGIEPKNTEIVSTKWESDLKTIVKPGKLWKKKFSCWSSWKLALSESGRGIPRLENYNCIGFALVFRDVEDDQIWFEDCGNHEAGKGTQ